MASILWFIGHWNRFMSPVPMINIRYEYNQVIITDWLFINKLEDFLTLSVILPTVIAASHGECVYYGTIIPYYNHSHDNDKNRTNITPRRIHKVLRFSLCLFLQPFIPRNFGHRLRSFKHISVEIKIPPVCSHSSVHSWLIQCFQRAS